MIFNVSNNGLITRLNISSSVPGFVLKLSPAVPGITLHLGYGLPGAKGDKGDKGDPGDGSDITAENGMRLDGGVLKLGDPLTEDTAITGLFRLLLGANLDPLKSLSIEIQEGSDGTFSIRSDNIDIGTYSNQHIYFTPAGLRFSTDVTLEGQVKIISGSPGAGKVWTSDPVGFGTWQDIVAEVTAQIIHDALGFTPYSDSNPAAFISGIDFGLIIAGLGFTPYSNTNPDGYITLGSALAGLNITGGSVADTDSVLQAFGKVQNQISGLLGGATYQSTWNAASNSPALASGIGTKGFYYIVATPGATSLDGITDWKVGDWAIFNGATWNKVDNTDAVSSVNGQTGAVSLVKGDIGLGNVDNTADAAKPVSTAQQTALNLKQDTLASGTNIKSVNGNSLLGAGNLVVGLTASQVLAMASLRF